MELLKNIDLWNEEFENKTPLELLKFFIDKYKNRIALASSMSAEDQIITHFIALIDKNTKVFTLDTGRLFPETYSLIERTKLFFGLWNRSKWYF